MAHIVVIGGTGYAGSHIVREAVRRGHRVPRALYCLELCFLHLNYDPIFGIQSTGIHSLYIHGTQMAGYPLSSVVITGVPTSDHS